jgi:adenylate cyclase
MSEPRVLETPLETRGRDELLSTTRILLAEAQAIATRVEVLNEIAIAVNLSLSLDEILLKVGQLAKWLLDFEHCSLCLRQEADTRKLVVLFGDVPVSAFLTMDDASPISRAFETMQPQLVRTKNSFSNFPSQLVIPLVVERTLLGTLNFASARENAYSEPDMRLANLLAVQIAAAIRNAEQFSTIRRLYSELDAEKEKTERLLRNVLPTQVAQELKEKGQVEPVQFESATVMFCDFIGFTRVAASMAPRDLLQELDICFTQFDIIIAVYGLEKLKTIGDSYMCVGGVPIVNKTHAQDTARAAMEMRAWMRERQAAKEREGIPYWDTRIGIHSGPLIAGVIGTQKFEYDVWGNTVNTASRLETACPPGEIAVSQATCELLGADFACESYGSVTAKGVELEMFLLKTL